MRILIHNSDSPHNRGDRAILAGIIELVRRRWPDAEIRSLSQFRGRDERWFGIRFLPQSPYSTNPLHWLSLLRQARRSDLVLWGGGEILKDYTNRLGLVYWLLKLTLLRAVNRNIIGAFQGIGPTRAPSSRRLIAAAVSRTRAFVVRDEESREKLLAWGVRVPVIASFDPAVLGQPHPVDDSMAAMLGAAGIELADIDGAIGFGIRRWFHYAPSGWLPHRFRRSSATATAGLESRVDRYRTNLAALADRLIESLDRPVVFFPMHLAGTEGDAEFAGEVIAAMRNGDRTSVIARDDFSSAEYAGIMTRLSLFVASRLHSAILATTAGVPSFVLYYVDKGRLYFEQLGMPQYSAPIETVLEPSGVDDLFRRISELDANGVAVRLELAASLDGMATRIEADFDRALAGADRPRSTRGVSRGRTRAG